MTDVSPAQEIDAIIQKTEGWRGDKLAQLRTIILKADAGIAEEVKWRKPSRPEGVPVWSYQGNLCVADILKQAVRLTFPKGSRFQDPTGLFNARLDSKEVRAIDFYEDAQVNEAALKGLVHEAIKANLG